MPANLLRGAFGFCLHESDPAVYARVFAPNEQAGGPSGLANRPRPFVFRAAHLDGVTVTAGADFFFDVHLFDTAHPELIASFVKTLEAMGERGLGPERARAELVGTVLRQSEGEVDAAVAKDPHPVTMALSPERDSIGRLGLRFITATELKDGDQLAEQPVFRALACRARDRISSLMSFYGDGAPPVDFGGFAQRASAVRMTHCEIQHVMAKRRSSRTAQVHPLGGFIGTAEYEGELAEFLPWLRAAEWTGVGRQTVWGKGQIEVSSKQ